MVVTGSGRLDSLPLLHAPDDTLEARNSQAGQGDRDLIVGLHVLLLPTLHGAEADAADKAVIELYRLQLQHRRDSAAAANAERYLAHTGDGCPQWVFPGDCPVRWLGLPAGSLWTLALAQHDAVGGERQAMVEPVLTPISGLLGGIQRQGHRGTIAEVHRNQSCKACLHVPRAVGPVPDEQADLRGGFPIQHLPRHRPGDTAACPDTAGFGLDMVLQAPVQLTLQD